jgi:starvation-inducible DNA-binding protein
MMQARLKGTKNDLPQEVRHAMIALLNQQLADAIDLGLQAKQAHWNVKGPSFLGLHQLFDETAKELAEFTDEIAERAVTLGGSALGTARSVATRSRLSDYASDCVGGMDHIDALSQAMSCFGKSARAAIDRATSGGDVATADLFTGVTRSLDKLLWKVESHAHAKD